MCRASIYRASRKALYRVFIYKDLYRALYKALYKALYRALYRALYKALGVIILIFINKVYIKYIKIIKTIKLYFYICLVIL